MALSRVERIPPPRPLRDRSLITSRSEGEGVGQSVTQCDGGGGGCTLRTSRSLFTYLLTAGVEQFTDNAPTGTTRPIVSTSPWTDE